MNLQEQIALRTSLSEERFAPYRHEAEKHFTSILEINERALELYCWAADLAGMFYTQILYVEVAARNAINRELTSWNATHRGGAKNWTRSDRRHSDLNHIINSHDIGKAISLIRREKLGTYHPKHPDIIAKLTFSFWVNLIKDQTQPSDSFRKRLWEEGLNKAFPYAQENNEQGQLDLEKTRRLVADQLSSILTLRNRIAHHDNLLGIDHELLIHRMYAILGRIGGENLTQSVDAAPLRAHLAKDPRKHWIRS